VNFNFKSILFAGIAIILMSCSNNVFALADSSNHTVSKRETDTFILYYGTLSFSTADSTNSLFTKALDMTWVDVTQPILLSVRGNSAAAAQDVDMFIEGSNWLQDSTFENYDTNAYFDDVDLFSSDGPLKAVINYKVLADDSLVTGVGAQRVYNTTIAGTVDPAFLCRFIRVEAAGQTGNRSEVVLEWELVCRKKAGASRKNAGAVFDVVGGL